MKNLLMMILVTLLVLGVVYIVKHRRVEIVHGPAFNNGLPIESQPPGPYDGEYTLTTAVCSGKSGKESKIPDSMASRVKIRGMTAKIFRKAGHCEIAQNLQIAPAPDSPTDGNTRIIQFKQDRVECAPDCPCFTQVTGSVFIDIDLSKHEISMIERIRSEKEICDGKLPVTLKYVASMSQ